MNASYQWLREFVAFDHTPAELRDLLTARCATVDDVVALRHDLAGIVIGRVIEAARHPDSDHLWVTKVDAGGGVLHRVVCGASNVTAGTLYPFAPVGTTLPNGLTIEKRKIRGEVSEGMLCSARELGLGTDHEGILALDLDAVPGARFLDVMPVGDTRLVVDVLPNRPDLLSHRGLAREIAAATGAELGGPPHPPAALTHAAGSAALLDIEVAVEDREGAPRYMTAIIRGVKVGPAPDWLAGRIEAIGGRSINNIVDVTNYMLHGFGQPMHAFDLSRFSGGKVIVRRARNGERIVTLDGVERTLDDSMTIIADESRPQAIAGVIGGNGSEVGDSTTDLLLEVAAFDPKRIRATRRKLGVSTDASYRFERGVDRIAIPDLLAYAAELITRVAGGFLHGSPTDAHQPYAPPEAIRLRPARVALVLGEEIGSDEIARNLGGIGFTVERVGKDFMVSPPSFRGDVTGEIELIEEVARLHGYEHFSSSVRPFRPGNAPDAPLDILARRVRAELVAHGLLEARPMPFVREGNESHRVRNPLADNEAYLRSTILDSLSGRVEYNFTHMQRDIRLFEVGTVFTLERVEESGAPRERMHVAAVLAGDRVPPHFADPPPSHFDEWDAKGLAERLAAVVYPRAEIRLAPSAGNALWIVEADGAAIGSVVRLVLDAPVWAAAAFGVEIDMEAGPGAIAGTVTSTVGGRDSVGVMPGAGAAIATGYAPTVTGGRYVAVPAMPAMEVDLALVVPEGTSASQVEEVIREAAGELLESLNLFDEFRGAGIPANTRSVAWRLTFRHPERTLRDREIQSRTSRILSALEESLGIRQRTS